ncbi:MAG: hypothetical protein A2X64_03675 [Ignavibacteria bacterium GWF2_33_9]|nr:MAG: hypothetical protein A2X64_03675 [Ignavibacteria bacterium GWF2_33_9]
MKKLSQLFLIALIGIGFASCSSKQDSLQLFFDSDFAANKVKSAEFTITYNNLIKGEEQEFSTKVFAAKAGDEEDSQILYRIEENGGTVITFDGKTFIVKDEQQKSLSASDDMSMASKLASEMTQSFYMIIDNTLDTAGIRKSSEHFKYIGETEINGEKFYEVSQSADGHMDYTVENHYFFSAEDKLMKKYTSKIEDKSKKVVQNIQIYISNVKLDEKIPANLFTQPMDIVNYKFTDLDSMHTMEGEMGGMDNPHGDNAGAEVQDNGLLQVGSQAPDWALLDANGNKVSLNSLKGKVVVLDFWATWCNPCKIVMPTIQKIHDKYKSKNVLVYGVNTWEKSDASKFMKENKYTYGLLLKGDKVAENYKVTGIPSLYVIDKNGKIILAEVGVQGDLEQKLAKAIESSL